MKHLPSIFCLSLIFLLSLFTLLPIPALLSKKNHDNMPYLTYLSQKEIALLQTQTPPLWDKISKNQPISVYDVILLQNLEFSSEVIIAIIAQTKTQFLLSIHEIILLQKQGVPFPVINYMIKTKRTTP